MSDDRVKYWLETAEYDLETARAMLKARRYLYVGFMCHQVIEKALKALIAATGHVPPYIHNLSKLAESSGTYSLMDTGQKDVLDELEPLNIQARYPEDRISLLGKLSRDRCRKLIAQTEELYRWIRARL